MLAEGEFAQVLNHLRAAGSKPVSARGLLFHDSELYSMIVDAAALQYNESILQQYVTSAEKEALRDGHKLCLAVAHRAWGVLYELRDEYELAESRLMQAHSIFEDLGTQWQIGRTLFELAEVALSQRQWEEARKLFSRALLAFEEVAAGPDLERTKARLASLNP